MVSFSLIVSAISNSGCFLSKRERRFCGLHEESEKLKIKSEKYKKSCFILAVLTL